MRRYLPILIAGVAMIATACGDVFAPTRTAAPASLGRFAGPQAAAKDAYVPPFATRVTVTIPAAGGVISVGNYRVYFSPNALCDPATSGYGPGTWDKACTPLGADYTLPAAYWTENGASFVEFLDDLRFDPSRWVIMVAKAPDGASEILYFTRTESGELQKVRESESDESVKTYLSSTGELFRRVKHFSGFLVSSGRWCEEGDPDPECQEGQ